ncbi:hypothetical protein BJX61DRAFT_508189 [Aspergillus egyptiacus]|nr:hypothetical protein BJX61DRAFT_508189 [Aspergillus egyptiacus]
MRFTSFVAAVAALPVAALAVQVGDFDSESCAAPDEFISCYEDADAWYEECTERTCNARDYECLKDCRCGLEGEHTRCAATFCWNMAYSCEYQLQTYTAVNSACYDAGPLSIPFWPPPDNADGGCSCNIGELGTAMERGSQTMQQCIADADLFTNIPAELEPDTHACICCGISSTLSVIPEICPGLDPDVVFGGDIEELLSEGAAGIAWTQCGEFLEKYDCVADFGYPSNIETYYGPGALPSGTETFGNVGTLTTPPSATETYTMGSNTFTVNPVLSNDAVPTGSAESAESNESSNTNDSDNDSSDSGTGDDESEVGSGNEEIEPPQDGAIQLAVDPMLTLAVAALLGVAYVL